MKNIITKPETIKGVKYVPIGYYGKYGIVNNPKTIKENLEHILKYDPLQVLNEKRSVKLWVLEVK